MDHVAIRPRREEGRLHNILGGGSWVSLGGEVELFGGGGGGKLPLYSAPPPLLR